MSFWRGRRVFVTGHTGFKGSWLSLWLGHLGAEVCGVALDPPTDPSIFKEARVSEGMRSEIGDIRDLERVRSILREHRPEVVFHLAAQPLVRKSYEDPVGTYATNVMGTVNLLESVRGCDSVRAVVVITTDKCYDNKEWVWPYRETDRLGGYDPYSNSKACAELVVSAYRNSFFSAAQYDRHGLAIASARAGNVIGGGDWAEDRLVPDLVRGLLEGRKLTLRNPGAIRPWQHVLEPLGAYLLLAERLFNEGAVYGEAFNFGPEDCDVQQVGYITRKIADLWGGDPGVEIDTGPRLHEANTLRLDCSKASAVLGWRPHLSLDQALKLTVGWYRNWDQGGAMREYSLAEIERYIALFSSSQRGTA